MTYELIIENNKEKQVIAFLKELDFVKLKKLPKSKIAQKKIAKSEANDLPYFGACVNWDVEASDLRKSANKRISEW
jgi:hypothetical protein